MAQIWQHFCCHGRARGKVNRALGLGIAREARDTAVTGAPVDGGGWRGSQRREEAEGKRGETASLTEKQWRRPAVRKTRRHGLVDGKEGVLGLAEVGEDVVGVRLDVGKVVEAADGGEAVGSGGNSSLEFISHREEELDSG